ncbi:hypothetical protein HYPSUDRAFT_561437 [Hypholoma sublateritium FD-334 SS-4]|uniref:Uncharacterized protein n=1 Tax=Hypholoma sublateritium (strain FD-334 SS-4) TaxID=945553 RepID=A0A0D2L9I3_HYPSF|nr:hypothetical protein HYPSUDRAFT_561437 [Hypholoma sublateritium FD-334 SS-4]
MSLSNSREHPALPPALQRAALDTVKSTNATTLTPLPRYGEGISPVSLFRDSQSHVQSTSLTRQDILPTSCNYEARFGDELSYQRGFFCAPFPQYSPISDNPYSPFPPGIYAGSLLDLRHHHVKYPLQQQEWKHDAGLQGVFSTLPSVIIFTANRPRVRGPWMDARSLSTKIACMTRHTCSTLAVPRSNRRIK